MKSILDPSFKYTPSVNTDIRRLFARVRQEMEHAAKREAASPLNVQPLQTRKASQA